MWEAAQLDFERDRDLLFHFFGCVTGKESDDGHLDVGDIRESFDGQGFECRHAGSDEEKQEQRHEERLVDRERDEFSDHLKWWFIIRNLHHQWHG